MLKFKFGMTPAEIRLAIEQSLPDDEAISIFIHDARCNGQKVAIAATGRHLVIFKKGWWRRTYDFHAWGKFVNVVLEERFGGAAVTLEKKDGGRLHLDGLKVEEARLFNGQVRKSIARMETKSIAAGFSCPYCKEPVKHGAQKCPHCHSELPPP